MKSVLWVVEVRVQGGGWFVPRRYELVNGKPMRRIPAHLTRAEARKDQKDFWRGGYAFTRVVPLGYIVRAA